MKNCYLILLDTTKERTDINQMMFVTANPLTDVAGYVKCFAIQNNSPQAAIRLFISPDKKTWLRMRDDFLHRVSYGAKES